MKRLDLTPELLTLIKSRVGEDVNLEGIAVFEAITLNSNPLPGKVGTIWEGAVATPLTLRQIVDHINNGGHIPLILNHNLEDMPVGRLFHAGLHYGDDGAFEVRTLFYLDATEALLSTKIDANSIDEVSISFLPTQYQCSECDFDYLSEGANWENFFTRTCDQGHTVGTDGVHIRMIGLAQLVETSLVARGAADNPKIVGRSGSKLAPASAQRLAARGFEIDSLVCRASLGESETMNTEKLTNDLVDAKTELGILKAAATQHDAALNAATARGDDLQTQLTAAAAQVAQLTADLETAKSESKADEASAAVAYLGSVLSKLYVAAGEEAPANVAEMSVADLTAAIDAKTQGLTALIPAGGASTSATAKNDARPVKLSAFTTRKN